MKGSPYVKSPDQLRARLTDPAVNTFEHEVNWLRFKALLPTVATSVLDFGCGPGNFTAELASIFPEAEVIGTDEAEAILPEDDLAPNLQFEVWDGRMPFRKTGFDLVVAKMVLHYLDEASYRPVVANLSRLVSAGGSLVISVPHPSISMRYNTAKSDISSAYHQPGVYTREIGNTGLRCSMMHRSIADWTDPFTSRLGRSGYVLDEPAVDDMTLKRLNVLFPPNSEAIDQAYNRLSRVDTGRAEEVAYSVDPNTPEGRFVTTGESLPYPIESRS